ncbi:MAG: hypothetical protein OEQ13_09500 [Acidobacteriota bacterium]|nr:hypothetical protein [Acidobacteriota bacterium]
MVIGLTGPNAAGKGEAAEILRALDFSVHSLSDVVREAASALGRGHDRDTLIHVGRELRRLHGPGILAERILPRLGDRSVVDSIRHPEEVRVLRERGDFCLVGVDAPLETRWQRARRRGRSGDGGDIDDFRRKERRENEDRLESQQLRRTLDLADIVLVNDGSLGRLQRRLETLVEKLEIDSTAGRGRRAGARPSDDACED